MSGRGAGGPLLQAAKAEAFWALHAGPGAFVIPNPWDAGSASVLAGMGFRALATTSAGAAYGLGVPDGGAGRERVLANARAIVEATALPVSGDLEDGFGGRPEDCAETIGLAAAVGLVGGSIEDTTNEPGRPIHDFDHAVARVAAAVAAARGLGFPFMVTARAENFLHGRADLADTIRRLQAFEAVGADVLYAPALPDLDAVRAVCGSVSRPVNVLAGGPGLPGVEALAAAGVRRISVGSLLSRAAMGAFVRAAEEMRDGGTFGFAGEALGYAAANGLMRGARG